MPSDVKFEIFKGANVICIPCGEYEGETQWLKMGYRKAKAVLDYADEIEKFCIDQEERKSKYKS